MKSSNLLQYAKDLRKSATNAEVFLWIHLRANRLGCKFKRQVPLESYIADFVCFEKNLIIELDGGQHLEARNYDRKRSEKFNADGFRVIRFWNNEVLRNIDVVLSVIFNALYASEANDICLQERNE